MGKGEIYKILQDVYKVRCSGSLYEVRQRIIRMQISLRTGLNIRDYSPESMDSEEDIQKVLGVVRGPGIGLTDYEYQKGGDL